MEIGTHDAKPVIALAMGDPVGISPELTAKAVGLAEIQVKARLIVVGDRRVFDEGMGTAGVKTEVKAVTSDAFVEPRDGDSFSSTLPTSIRLRSAAALPPGRAANSRSRITGMHWS